MKHLVNAKGCVIRSRDIFLHDGQHLRRVRLSVGLQALVAALIVALIAWSGFATARIISGPRGDLATLAAATELRARQIEQRQDLLAKMLSGQDVGALPATTRISSLPAELAAPLARADRAMVAQALATAHEFDARYARTADALRQRGINPGRVLAEGGPYEPVTGGDATFKQLFTSWKKLDNIADGAIAVPSDKPVRIAAFTSGYGVRSDPFKGRAAMHAGIDLAGPIGTPIYATADGTITDAGFNNGGYGNLVKIDHGRGIETRYGHMSAILVHAGQHVVRGQQIGRMGSTGRSTGSHLHYEVRIDTRAVNPIPFMKSSDYLFAMQRKSFGTHSMDGAVALGGPDKR